MLHCEHCKFKSVRATDVKKHIRKHHPEHFDGPPLPESERPKKSIAKKVSKVVSKKSSKKSSKTKKSKRLSKKVVPESEEAVEGETPDVTPFFKNLLELAGLKHLSFPAGDTKESEEDVLSQQIAEKTGSFWEHSLEVLGILPPSIPAKEDSGSEDAAEKVVVEVSLPMEIGEESSRPASDVSDGESTVKLESDENSYYGISKHSLHLLSLVTPKEEVSDETEETRTDQDSSSETWKHELEDKDMEVDAEVKEERVQSPSPSEGS